MWKVSDSKRDIMAAVRSITVSSHGRSDWARGILGWMERVEWFGIRSLSSIYIKMLSAIQKD